MRQRRLSHLLLPLLTLMIACGVPISAEEITATAESEQAAQLLSTLNDNPTSSRAAEVAAQVGRLTTPAPASTAAVLSQGAPAGTATAGASGTPAATTTVAATASVSATAGTPGATASASTTPTPSVTPQPTPVPPTSEFVAQVVNLVNDYRAANGLSRLKADAYITTAANSYANYQATTMGSFKYISHVGVDGSTSESRMAAAGYAGCFWGETLAAGQTSPAAAVTTWKQSANHNPILLSPEAAAIGVGYFYNPDSYYKHYWVLMTGRPSC